MTTATRVTVEAARDALIASLHGTVLDIGAGTPRRRAHLAPGSRWVGLEPDESRHHRLVPTVAGEDRLLLGRAEHIPLPDGSVDAALTSFTLCSVDDQPTALAEIRRVVRPGGAFAFAEHVGAPYGSWSRRLQRVATPFSLRFDHGCRPTRDTLGVIEALVWEHVETETYDVRVAPGVIVPFVVGRAVLPSAPRGSSATMGR
ncbi:class I SAM-dependent methyltransferase [Luteipulveratus sp. YIM 133132]|uniref:class I SAM-dependent methyltransferase n=1 Tax=Luteipulveratus flavus TaxID=3031728 RepID=UPI0023B13D16|nr:class I SAM-dependent methyltransferase [Luteipulveratus sp. YIM 133132]MDE9364728.1 class I SAM-dependent methyltransferase [Luteipulveratus sp. YIM 133132]